MRTCIQCGKQCESDAWQPGEVSIFGSVFACSIECAETWGKTADGIKPECKPGQPGWEVDVEGEVAKA